MSLQIFICLCLSICVLSFGMKTRIIGGLDVNIVDFPYSASLRRLSDNEHMCGGCIISNQHILTAAHCFGEIFLNKDDLIIHIGTSYLSNNKGSSLLPENIVIHAGFVGLRDNQTYMNDIAIVKIQGSIEFNEFQNKVNLPTKDIYSNDIGLLSGWGYTTYPSNVANDKLQSTWMKIYENYHCRSFFSILVHTDQFCGFRKKGIGACDGDSGGPLVSKGVIIGLVSSSIPCATGVPDLYTKIYSHLDFITLTLASS